VHIFSANGIDEVELQVRRHWPRNGAPSTVDIRESPVQVPRASRLTPVNFKEHSGIFTIGLMGCSSITYLMGPPESPVYTHGAMSHIPSSYPGDFCSPQAALATVPGDDLVVLDVVISVHDMPTKATIDELSKFVEDKGIPEDRIWVYDGRGDGGSFCVRRDGRAGIPVHR
jgi:hypothetical protein